MVRVSIQLKMALGLSVLILIALLWKIPESLQDESVWTLFSILTEALQLLVPWRHGDFMDLAANILGVGLAGVLVKTIHSLKKTI